jgi:serine/threonine protein kinase
MPLQTGQILNNRYRIVRKIAEGGFGAIYRGYDITLKRPCALKENFDTSPQAQKQFEHEAVILANLDHPNLPRVTDHFSIPAQGQYLVMDFIEGEDLQEMLDRVGSLLPESQVLPWIDQICDALEYLHSQKPPIIHRDIKPANIKITPQDNAILVDFGIAKVYDPHTKTTIGARAVTPGYSPPEQYGQGTTDARSDVYALGATLYTLLTGKEPQESVEILAGVKSPVPLQNLSNPSISAGVSAAVGRAMEIDAARRFQSVAEFNNALRKLYQRKPVATIRPAPPTKKKSAKPWKSKGCIGAVMLAILGVAGCWGLYLAFEPSIIGLFDTTLTTPGSTSPSPTSSSIRTTQTPTPVMTPTATKETVTLLFYDDFSDPSSGWDRVNVSEGITDYEGGEYRIWVNTSNTDVWANPGLHFTDVSIEVNAAKVGGPDDNDFGIICRYQDVENFYFFLIGSDGYYGIGKIKDGSQDLIGMETMLENDVIRIGNTTNRIKADCAGNVLTLYVNGKKLKQVQDSDFASGDVGLIAGTFDQSGVDIHFDEYRVTEP